MSIYNILKPGMTSEEIPQQKEWKEDYDIEYLIKKTASLLGCDHSIFKTTLRVERVDKHNKTRNMRLPLRE